MKINHNRSFTCIVDFTIANFETRRPKRRFQFLLSLKLLQDPSRWTEKESLILYFLELGRV